MADHLNTITLLWLLIGSCTMFAFIVSAPAWVWREIRKDGLLKGFVLIVCLDCVLWPLAWYLIGWKDDQPE